VNLEDAAKSWPTPDTAPEAQWRSPAAQEPGISAERLTGEPGSRMYDKETGRLAQYGNTQLAQLWQTPNSQDFTSRRQVTASEREPLLRRQAQLWATPQASEAQGKANRGQSRGEPTLKTQSKGWATPNVRDHHSQGAGMNPKARSMALSTSVEKGQPSLPAQVTQTAGATGSPTTLVLNPRFVGALMGWPDGLSSCACSETVSCQWSRLMHSVLWRLGW
jgi:hypothetical protein